MQTFVQGILFAAGGVLGVVFGGVILFLALGVMSRLTRVSSKGD